MGRRMRLRNLWAMLATAALLVALVGTRPAVAQASSDLIISVVDTAGAAVTGAAFGIYDASVDPDGTSRIADDAALIAGPVVTDADGQAIVAGLPDQHVIGVRQLAVPDGYLADPAGDRFLTTGATAPATLTFVNAAAPVGDGVIAVTVTDASGADVVSGATVSARPIDAAGTAGVPVASATSDAAGSASLDVTPGRYLVSVTPPDGYGAASAQQVDVAAGTGAAGLSFQLSPPPPTEPAEPTVPPTEPATETPTAAAPVETPTAPDVTATATTAPPTETATETAPTATAASSASAVPTASDSGFVPNQPATVVVQAIVCTSDDPAQIGTMLIKPDASLASDQIPAACRPANEGEFTFLFRDPVTSSPWDDITLGRRPTDASGLASFTTAITREGQALYTYEEKNPGDFVSTPVTLVANGTVSLLAIRVIGPPHGDVVVQSINAQTGATVVGVCYQIAAAGAETAAITTACDTDDGTSDGLVTFPTMPNGAYVVAATTTPDRFVGVGAAMPVTVDSANAMVQVPITPFGAIQLGALVCTTLPAGAAVPTPTPAAGDGIAALDGQAGNMAATATAPLVSFAVLDGSLSSADGTGGEQTTAAAGCTPTAAHLTIVAPDGSATAVTIDAAGFADPVSLPPATDGAGYVIRDDATGATVAVPVRPGATTTVLLAIIPAG